MRSARHLVLIVGLLPWLTGAAVYRWVDENGVVNYTQIKPEGVDAELVSGDTGRRKPAAAPARPAPAIPAGDSGQTLTPEQQQMLSDLQAAEQARQAEIARVRESNCQEARDLLQRLTARGRIRIAGPDGEERVMPEEERQRRIDEAQRAIVANCSETASR
ncbi:MAG: hypothetical protein CMQ43_05150 [Gammaproteobacteria bacterium]|nr:hypothetical protein [Gammaproteobacteria bacterium]MBK80287.1 hypothetical protein [Gammaproteobacteria bacterium]|tara:strand:- start:347 stop:829 length:483 start_codon:yes stop_codon:yes gene_type:complete